MVAHAVGSGCHECELSVRAPSRRRRRKPQRLVLIRSPLSGQNEDENSKESYACSSQTSLLSDAGSTPAASTKYRLSHLKNSCRLRCTSTRDHDIASTFTCCHC